MDAKFLKFKPYKKLSNNRHRNSQSLRHKDKPTDPGPNKSLMSVAKCDCGNSIASFAAIVEHHSRFLTLIEESTEIAVEKWTQNSCTHWQTSDEIPDEESMEIEIGTGDALYIQTLDIARVISFIPEVTLQSTWAAFESGLTRVCRALSNSVDVDTSNSWGERVGGKSHTGRLEKFLSLNFEMKWGIKNKTQNIYAVRNCIVHAGGYRDCVSEDRISNLDGAVQSLGIDVGSDERLIINSGVLEKVVAHLTEEAELIQDALVQHKDVGPSLFPFVNVAEVPEE